MFKKFIKPTCLFFFVAIVLMVAAFAPVIFAWSALWLFLTVPIAIAMAVATPTLLYMLAVLTHGSH